MKSNDLSGLSNEKLIKRRDLFKGFLIGIGIVWLIMVAVMIYLFATKDMSKVSFAAFIPIFVLPVTLMPLFLNVGLLDKEVRSRKL